jgi:hypothetical protein
MARRSAPPPKPKSPNLTVGQKRGRIERLQKCITRLEAFDPQKARKHAPAILELEAAIDRALASAFGYGTPAYLRYNQAATLDTSPLVANATARSPVIGPVGGPGRQNAKAQCAKAFRITRSGRSRSFVKRSAHLKKRLPMQNQLRRQHSNQRAHHNPGQPRRLVKFECPGVGAASLSKPHGVVWHDGGEGAIDQPTRPSSLRTGPCPCRRRRRRRPSASHRPSPRAARPRRCAVCLGCAP